MKITVLSSGSCGNCYIVKDSCGNAVILDCGLKFKEITHHPEFPSFNKIDLLFVSHEHLDHSKSLREFKKTGCEIISYEILETKIQNWFFENWDAFTFPIVHNSPNWGIVIKSKVDGEKLCYMTDFCKAPLVESCDHYIFEVNYISSVIEDKIDNGEDLKHLGFNNHHSLEDTIEYFEKIKTRPKSITCCHLSSVNAMEGTIIKQLKPFADKINIAKKGEVYVY